MMFVSFKSCTTGVTHKPSGEPEFIPCFSGACVARSLVFCVMFCRSLFVLLFFFFWTLCSLCFFKLRLLIHFLVTSNVFRGTRVAQWVRSLDLTTHTSLSPIRRGFAPGFVNYKKGALDLQPQVIKFTSGLPMVGGSLRILRLPPLLKLVTMI